jgi:hypothetical protein
LQRDIFEQNARLVEQNALYKEKVLQLERQIKQPARWIDWVYGMVLFSACSATGFMNYLLFDTGKVLLPGC